MQACTCLCSSDFGVCEHVCVDVFLLRTYIYMYIIRMHTYAYKPYILSFTHANVSVVTYISTYIHAHVSIGTYKINAYMHTRVCRTTAQLFIMRAAVARM
jgi:hypothetical protein